MTLSQSLRSRISLSSRSWPIFIMILAVAFIGITVVVPMGTIFGETLFVDGRFSFQVYVEVFSRGHMRQTLLNTAVFVFGTTLSAIVQGVLLAWLVEKTNVPGRRLMSIIPVLTLFLPPIVGGIGWVLLLSERVGLINVLIRDIFPVFGESGPFNITTLGGMIWVTGIYTAPYVYLTVSAAFKRYDSSLDEAARVTGVSAFTILRTITLPVLAPGIFAGAILAFTMAMAQFAIPQMLGGTRVPVITTEIYAGLRSFPRDVHSAAALSVLAVVAVILALIIQRFVLRGSQRFAVIGGRGSSSALTDLGRLRWVGFGFLLVYVATVVALPILALINVSLRQFWNTDLSLDSITLDNYEQVTQNPITWESIGNSLTIAFIASILGIVLAVLVAFVTQRAGMRGRGALDSIATLPAAIPATVLGAGMLLFFLNPPFALYGSNALLVIAFMAHFLPHGYRSSVSGFQQLSPQLEEASLVAGSFWARTLFSVTLPLVAPAVISGWIFMFILMSRELGASVLLASPSTPLMALQILDLYVQGRMPELAAFSMIVLVISSILTIVARRIGDHSARH